MLGYLSAERAVVSSGNSTGEEAFADLRSYVEHNNCCVAALCQLCSEGHDRIVHVIQCDHA